MCWLDVLVVQRAGCLWKQFRAKTQAFLGNLNAVAKRNHILDNLPSGGHCR